MIEATAHPLKSKITERGWTLWQLRLKLQWGQGRQASYIEQRLSRYLTGVESMPADLEAELTALLRNEG